MKQFLMASALTAALMGSAARVENIGVSMALCDGNFLTVPRKGRVDCANIKDGVTLQIEKTQNDMGERLNQIQSFIALGV